MAHHMSDKKWFEIGMPIAFAVMWGILARHGPDLSLNNS